MRVARLLAILAAFGGNIPAGVAQQQDLGNLPPGPGREETFYLCSACHSIRLVTQQGLSRQAWDDTLDWMVEEQGMPKPEKDERALILDYLAEHYGREAQREDCVTPWGRTC